MAKDIAELFGFEPTNLSAAANLHWVTESCPFTHQACSKGNHDRSLVYGTCTMLSNEGYVVVCPNRLYADEYASLRTISSQAFGDAEFMMFTNYLKATRSGLVTGKNIVVALGANSGKEVKLGRSLSMDWILARLDRGVLQEYVGVEVQSIDITGNYRDNWHYYRNLRHGGRQGLAKPESGHGLNWANVHKRLIPQLIRKGVVYSSSAYARQGLYFVVPDAVFLRFEEVIGADFEDIQTPSCDTLTIHAYELAAVDPTTGHRRLRLARQRRISLAELSARFVSGPGLPPGSVLDAVIAKQLGVGLAGL
jgi:hypothetical protein